MQLACKSCRAKILAEDVNLERGLAKCRACQAVFDFTAEVARAGPDVQVPRPKRIKIWTEGRRLTLAIRWFHPTLFFLAFFCTAWDSFLVFWYSAAFRGENTPWLMIVFPIAHLAVGVGLTYFTLAGFLNRTTITVENGILRVRHRPVPWAGNLDVDVDTIDRFWGGTAASRNRHGSSQVYEISAVLKDGATLKLLGTLQDDQEALYLEQELQKHLGIEDRPVPGELDR